MITVEFRTCGFGLKRRFEFGDPRRSPITVLECFFVKFSKMRGDSKFVEFLRGYCDNDEFEWHPKVRLARRKAELDCSNYYSKYYKGEIRELVNKYEAVCKIKNKLYDEKEALLKVIKLKQTSADADNE